MINLLTLTASLALAGSTGGTIGISSGSLVGYDFLFKGSAFEEQLKEKVFAIKVWGGNPHRTIMTCDENLKCEYKIEDAREIIEAIIRTYCKTVPGGCRSYP